MTPAQVVRLAALVVIAGLAAVAPLLTGNGDESSAPPAATAPTQTPAAPSRVAVPTLKPTAASSPAMQAIPAAGSEIEAVALEAVAVWQDPDVDRRAAVLATLATADYQAAATRIDSTRVPTAVVSTTALRVEADGQALVDVELRDGTDLAALLVLESDRWLLADLQPVGSAAEGDA